MSRFEDGFVAHLEGSTALTSVGSTNIHPMRFPRDPTYPLLTYHKVSKNVGQTHGGPDSQETVRVQVDAYAESYDELVDVSRGLDQALLGINTTSTGVEFKAGFLESEQDLFEEEFTHEGVFRRRKDYMLTYVGPWKHWIKYRPDLGWPGTFTRASDATYTAQ